MSTFDENLCEDTQVAEHPRVISTPPTHSSSFNQDDPFRDHPCVKLAPADDPTDLRERAYAVIDSTQRDDAVRLILDGLPDHVNLLHARTCIDAFDILTQQLPFGSRLTVYVVTADLNSDVVVLPEVQFGPAYSLNIVELKNFAPMAEFIIISMAPAI